MINNFVQTTLNTTITTTSDRIVLDTPSTPYSLPHSDGGTFIIIDSICALSRYEVVKYSGYEADGITAIITERGADNSGAQSWGVGAIILQLLTANDLGDIKTQLDNIYTKSETDTLLDDKYSKSETDNLLDDKYSKSETDNLLDDKYSKSETDNLLDDKYSKSETDNLLDALNNDDNIVSASFDNATNTLTFTKNDGGTSSVVIPDDKVLLINDLTTGGTGKALTAEQGKQLKLLVDGKADKNGNATEKFKVADATADDEAVNKGQMDTDIATKQATLISGTNIKSVNGNSLLDGGDLEIETGVSFTTLWTGSAGTNSTLNLTQSVNDFDFIYFNALRESR
jgi:hypothetical protein